MAASPADIPLCPPTPLFFFFTQGLFQMKIATVQNPAAAVLQDRHAGSAMIFHLSETFRLDKMEKTKRTRCIKCAPHLALKAARYPGNQFPLVCSSML